MRQTNNVYSDCGRSFSVKTSIATSLLIKLQGEVWIMKSKVVLHN